MPGARAESDQRHRGQEAEGVMGLKSLGVRDLHYQMAFLACAVATDGKAKLGSDSDEPETAAAMKEKMKSEEWEAVFKMSQDKNLYNNLITSLFPTIHGNDEVKRGIMLMMFGGVPKTTGESTSLRGDINVCVVGDPSTAKSQFLKMVADFSPRAVYTSGKASTAAGLTAAVVRDEESGEFVIEAGALMLADNSVCCIDEFDKMNESTRSVLHEVMEQQTLSIAKAGIICQLNARTSLLAAANPCESQWNKNKTIIENIELPHTLLSRWAESGHAVEGCRRSVGAATFRMLLGID